MGLGNVPDKGISWGTSRASFDETIHAAYRRLVGEKLDRHAVNAITIKDKSNSITGLVILCDETASSASIHIHLPDLLSRSIIKEALSYAFNKMGIMKLFAEIRSNNKTMLDIAKRIGFTEVATIPDRYDVGVDQIIMVATEEDVARWIK